MKKTKNTTVQELHALNRHLHKQLSFKRSFLMSMLNGVGYALGASILAGILIAILSFTIRSIQDVPILNRLIQTNAVQSLEGSIE